MAVNPGLLEVDGAFWFYVDTCQVNVSNNLLRTHAHLSVGHGLCSAYPLLGAYLLTTYTYKCMCLLTRVYSIPTTGPTFLRMISDVTCFMKNVTCALYNTRFQCVIQSHHYCIQGTILLNSRTHTHFVNTWISNTSMNHIGTPPNWIREYSALNAAMWSMWSKHATCVIISWLSCTWVQYVSHISSKK